MRGKLITIIILMLLLSACEFAPTTNLSTDSWDASEEGPAPQPTETFTPEPELEHEKVTPETIVEEPVPEPTATFTPTPIHCMELIEPLDRSDFSGNARVSFSWGAHPDADSYLLNFVFPDGLG